MSEKEIKIRNPANLKELQTIKKLLVLLLLNQGIQADSLADLLEMDPADFSRMFPVRKLLKHKVRE
jgi:hypothetical protein